MQRGLLTTWRNGWQARGVSAWVLAAVLLGAYVDLYFTSHLDGPARAFGFPNRWTLYAAVYSAAMVVGGAFAWRRHAGSLHQRVRTCVNVGVQVGLAWLLPWFMGASGGPELYLSYFWPLSWDKLFPDTLASVPRVAAVWMLAMSLVGAPLLARRYGKRWYCSWICGCGGLAETFGDGWRHLADPSRRAWKIERASIYTVLASIVLLTILAWVAPLSGVPVLTTVAERGRSVYGFLVGGVFSGVLGVGLYPLMGTRVWCRFGCPMAALLGLAQKRGDFRVAVQPDLCIGCGNCTTYCEMGIDVRAYAMANQDVRRASCVGCGACAQVCPRGVLRITSDAPGAAGRWEVDVEALG